MDNISGVSAGEGGVFDRGDEELLARFDSYLVSELGRATQTSKGYRDALKRAGKRIDKPLSKVTSDDLRYLLRETDYAPSTKRGIVVAFHQFHSWGVMEGRWKRNGIAELRTPKVVHEPRAPLSQRDARRLLSEAQSPLQVRTIHLGLLAGMRVKESTFLDSSEWMPDRFVFFGKGGKKRTVPVHHELPEVREFILDKQPASTTSCQVVFGRLRDRLDLRDLEGHRATPHTLRRTFATAMYEAGTPWEVVAKVLGHGIDVTAQYARIGFDAMGDGVETVDYFGAPVQLTLF